MDAERALTVGIVALVAGSTTLFVVLTVVGSLTDGATWRFAVAGVLGAVAALAAGLRVHRGPDEGRLTGR